MIGLAVGTAALTFAGTSAALRNRAERSLDLNELRGQSRTLYVRISDRHPEDGWGGWLARVTLVMRR